MKKGILAICDYDQDYANHLMEYFADKEGMPFKIVAFTQFEKFLEFIKINSVDILLIADEMMKESAGEWDIKKILLLSSGEILLNHSDYQSIYKFQSSENIVRAVLEHYTDIYWDDGKKGVHPGKTEVISVYSPAGRVGKTTFAITLGLVLASEKTTLYINMEELSAFEQLFQRIYPADLSDLMYYFKQFPESLHIKLKAIVEQLQGLDYIPPMTNTQSLKTLDTEEWMNLIDRIISFGMYERIILDISNMVRDPLRLLDASDYIYMPVNEDPVVRMKTEGFIKRIEDTEEFEIKNKLKMITMPELACEEIGENFYERHLWGELGDIIREELKGELT